MDAAAMAADIEVIEHVRGCVFQHVTAVLIPSVIPAGEADEPVQGWDATLEGSLDDYKQLLKSVELRFANRRDGAGDTRARLSELVDSYLAGGRPRSRLHAEVFLLFIGHVDLINRFERLRFMNDGRQETRRQIKKWEDDVRYAVMMWINCVLANCLSAIANLKTGLDGKDLAFIANTCFVGDDPTKVADADQRFHVLRSLVMNPTFPLTESQQLAVNDQVLPTLLFTRSEFRRYEYFLTNYFSQVVSMPFDFWTTKICKWRLLLA